MEKPDLTMARQVAQTAKSCQRQRTGRKMPAVVGLLLMVGFCVQSRLFSADEVPGARVSSGSTYALDQSLAPAVDPFVANAIADPVGVFRTALDHYKQTVFDYSCTFEKQEMVGGQIRDEQVIQVKFREKPYSVNMLWTKNEDKARRAIYVEGRWTGDRGEKFAVVEPASIIARLFVSDVLRPIDGPDAKKAARRRIDQFGFRNSLQLILKYCDLSTARDELDVRYVGEGMLAGRQTYIFERRLPYTDDNGRYPDRLLVVHMDKEYLLPTCCISYADEGKTKLLGRYVISDVKFNVGLTDRDFARKP